MWIAPYNLSQVYVYGRSFSELRVPVIGQMKAYSFVPLWFCLFSLFFKQKIIHQFGTLLTVTMVFALICMLT